MRRSKMKPRSIYYKKFYQDLKKDPKRLNARKLFLSRLYHKNMQDETKRIKRKSYERIQYIKKRVRNIIQEIQKELEKI